MCAALKKCSDTRDSAIVHLLSLEKQSKEGRIRGFFQIPKFVEDKELCPVLALETYFSKVRSNMGARTLEARSGGSKNVTYRKQTT